MTKSPRGWKRPFDEPIPLPRGLELVTLQDAGNYITKLPKAEHDAEEWQAAMEALLLVVTLGGLTMFARIGVMQALNRKVERVFNPARPSLGTAKAGARPRKLATSTIQGLGQRRSSGKMVRGARP